MTIYPFSLIQLSAQLISSRHVSQLVVTDSQLFAAWFAALHDLIRDKSVCQQLKLSDKSQSFINELHQSIRVFGEKTQSMSLDDMASHAAVIDQLRKHLGQNLTAEYTGIFLSYMNAHSQLNMTDMIQFIHEFPLQLAKAQDAYITSQCQTYIERRINIISDMLNFNAAEQVLFEHAIGLTIDYRLGVFYKFIEQSLSKHKAIQAVEYALNSSIDELNAASALDVEYSKPLIYGMVHINQHGLPAPVSEFWAHVFIQETVELDKMFVQPIKTNNRYSSVVSRIDAEMVKPFQQLIETNQEPGCNFLVYGPSSLDKDQAILSVLGDKYTYYELATKHVAWGDEPSVALVAQYLLQDKSDPSILIIRDATRVLTKTGSKSFKFFGDKIEVEDESKIIELSSDEILLTKNLVPTIWYARDPKYLAEEAIGKFMLHLEVSPGTRLDRKKAVDEVANDLELSAETRQALSKFTQLGSMQVRTAARVMTQLNESEDLLVKLVEHSQKALGREATEELRTSVTQYSLELLNIASRFTPDQVIKALKKKPQGTLCFYGMPGTGKTQLAEYIANELDKPLLIKRASDILSKWVGDNEKHIADMFREAKAEGAILLLDEADSFLRDRSLAKSGWEVTMVNELLQQMERHSGIFICASNLFSQLDAAVIRRFTFKFSFQELDDQQRIKMFANETNVYVDETHSLYNDLMMIQHLTPGDFATVKRQSIMLDQELTPETWLIQLAEEAKAKLGGLVMQGYVSREQANVELK